MRILGLVIAAAVEGNDQFLAFDRFGRRLDLDDRDRCLGERIALAGKVKHGGNLRGRQRKYTDGQEPEEFSPARPRRRQRRSGISTGMASRVSQSSLKRGGRGRGLLGR